MEGRSDGLFASGNPGLLGSELPNVARHQRKEMRDRMSRELRLAPPVQPPYWLGKHCPLFSQTHGLGKTAHFFLKLRAHTRKNMGSLPMAPTTHSLSRPWTLRNLIGSFLFLLVQLCDPSLVLLCLSLESMVYGLSCDPKLFFLERTVTKIKNSILIKLQHYLAPKSQTFCKKDKKQGLRTAGYAKKWDP